MQLDHLAIEDLVSLQFGEIIGHRAHRMTQHLAGCAVCSQVFERLQGSMVEGGGPDRNAAADTGTLLSKIRTWDSNRVRDGRHGEGLKRRIAVELAPYVGQAGADALLRPVQDDGRDLLSTVAPLLVMFLGQRATSLIVTRVVEKSIVGSRTLCES